MGESPRLDPLEETRLLKLGYFAIMTERPPFNQDIQACKTPESAFLFSLEVEHMRVPDELKFDALKNDIPEPHRPRMERIWKKVLEMQEAWGDSVSALQNKWANAPDTPDKAAKRDVEQTSLSIRRDLHRAVAAIISIPQGERRSSRKTPLHQWKIEEEALRTKFYYADKNYLVALRMYYEALLEKPENVSSSDSVLPLNHPLRFQIVIRNRYLRLIDATHQAISIAKAAHHEQQARRLRKLRKIPYVIHPFSVEMAYIFDVVPYVIEEEKMPHNIVVGTTSAALHDVGEDTQLTLQDILRDFLAPRADHFDSRLDQAIESGFGLSRERVKRKMLFLLSDVALADLRIILGALSQNTKLSDGEKKHALKTNVAGPEKTLALLKLDDGVYRKWGLRPEEFDKPLKTFTEFSESFEPDVDLFLLRLGLIHKKAKQHALIMKMEDRTDNLKDSKGLPVARQATKLRAIVSRILAYAMLDYDQESFPLYNALPRLIDITLREYERFVQEHPQETIPDDAKFIDQLRIWQGQVRRFPVPDSMQRVLEAYEKGSEPAPSSGPLDTLRRTVRALTSRVKF